MHSWLQNGKTALHHAAELDNMRAVYIIRRWFEDTPGWGLGELDRADKVYE